jgi:hypothetical protein
MRSSKNSRPIVVESHEYRWRVTVSGGAVSVRVWPTNNVGGYICGKLFFGEASLDHPILTNRIIRRVICHAISEHGYDPNRKLAKLDLQRLNDVIQWDDALRGPNFIAWSSLNDIEEYFGVKLFEPERTQHAG